MVAVPGAVITPETSFVVMTFVALSWSMSFRGQPKYSKGPARLPSVFSFSTDTATVRQDALSHDGPAASETDCCFIGEEGRVSLVLELGNWSAISGRGRVEDDLLEDFFGESKFMWVNAVGFWRSLRSFLFPRRLFGLFEACEVSNDCNPY